MSILKLEPGQKVLFTITNIEEAAGNFGPQLKFTSDKGDTMFLNVEPALRGLGRIGLTLEGALDQTVEFERIVKNGTKYTNINKPGAAKVAATRPNVKQELSSGPHIDGLDSNPIAGGQDYPFPPTETGAAPADVESGSVFSRLDKIFALYSVCLDHVVAVEAPKLAKTDIGTSPESCAAMTATLFIQACQRGLAA